MLRQALTRPRYLLRDVLRLDRGPGGHRAMVTWYVRFGCTLYETEDQGDVGVVVSAKITPTTRIKTGRSLWCPHWPCLESQCSPRLGTARWRVRGYCRRNPEWLPQHRVQRGGIPLSGSRKQISETRDPAAPRATRVGCLGARRGSLRAPVSCFVGGTVVTRPDCGRARWKTSVREAPGHLRARAG